jgi:hypothetical protein
LFETAYLIGAREVYFHFFKRTESDATDRLASAVPRRIGIVDRNQEKWALKALVRLNRSRQVLRK